MNYYELLGVPENADQAAIKAAFRKKAKKYHPDTNPGDAKAEQIFKELNEAYSVLSDEAKKSRYDLNLHNKSAQGSAQSFEQGPKQQRKQSAPKGANPFMGFYGGFNFDDIMGAGMDYEKEPEKKQKKTAPGAPDFMNTGDQFAKFFGFKPK